MTWIVRKTQRNVKHWQSGDMALRWTAAGLLEAEKQFRKIMGYQKIGDLTNRIDRLRKVGQVQPTTDPATLVTA